MGMSMIPGLDIEKMVEVIVKKETIVRQLKHDNHVKNVNAEISAIGQIKSQLTNLQASLSKLKELSTSYPMKYSVTDASYFNTSLTSGAQAGVYQVIVKNLAQQQSLASSYYVSSDDSLGTGNLTITLGTYSLDNSGFTQNPDTKPVTISITEDNKSLSQICQAINKAQAGVTASLIQDSQGVRLAINSNNTGLNYAMKITGDISALNYDPTTSQTGLTQTMAAKNSLISINGLDLNQNSNQINNALTGLNLNLLKADPNTTVTLTVDNNKDQISGFIKDFVKQYNDSMTLLTNITGYNAETRKGGYFQGDSQLRSLKFELNKWATGMLPNQAGPLKSLSDLGITSNRQGLLEIDQTIFQKNLDNNYQDIGALFATNPIEGSESKSGVAVLLNNFLESYTSTRGHFAKRSEQLKLETKSLDEEQKQLDNRQELLTARYLKKYQALESLLAKLQDRNSAISQLADNLPKMNNRS